MVRDDRANSRWRYVTNALLVSPWLMSRFHYEGLCLVRVYALYGRSRRILILLLTIGMASIINACVSYFSQTPISMGSSLPQRRTCLQAVNQGVKQSLLYQAFQDVPSLRQPKGTRLILYVTRPIRYDYGHFCLRGRCKWSVYLSPQLS